MSVKRYKVEELNCCFNADMIEHPTGEYVEYSDYEKLKAEVDEYRKDVTASVDTLIDERNRLKAEVERLTAEVNYRKNMDTHIKIMADQYTPAKEGKPSV